MALLLLRPTAGGNLGFARSAIKGVDVYNTKTTGLTRNAFADGIVVGATQGTLRLDLTELAHETDSIPLTEYFPIQYVKAQAAS